MKELVMKPGQAVRIVAPPPAPASAGLSQKSFGTLIRSIEETWATLNEDRAEKLAAKLAESKINREQLMGLCCHLIMTGSTGLVLTAEAEAAIASVTTVKPRELPDGAVEPGEEEQPVESDDDTPEGNAEESTEAEADADKDIGDAAEGSTTDGWG